MSDDDDASRVLFKSACVKCGENNAMATYTDGHVHCFNPACNHHTGSKPVAGQSTIHPKAGRMTDALKADPITTATRSILPTTFQRYGYKATTYGKKAEPVHVWTIYGQDNQPAYNKLRFLTNKDFVVLPLSDTHQSPTDAQLWGMHVWGDQHDKRVVVTEGEIDAMSVAQASDFKYPVVSINGGAASAAKCLKANYRWLDRFTEIILWFDDDDAGMEAVAQCAPLFASGKVKLAKVDGFKDANEALQAKRKADIELAVYGATLWAPAGIVNAADCLAGLTEDEEVPMWSFPFPLLQDLTRGCRRGEVYYHVAGTGIGKSSIINEFIHHWLFGTGHTEAPAKIGILAFETLLRETQLGIMSVHASQRLHLEPVTKPKMAALHQEVFGSRRVELFDPETAEWGFDPLMSYCRFLVRALDCNIIIIDPLSFLAAQMDERDERIALDKASVKLAKLSKELGVALHIAHHLTRPEGVGHEEGGKIAVKQVRGSGGIIMFANGAIGYERNQQAEGPARLVTTMRSLKWRWTGYTGVLGYTLYDEETGRTNNLDPLQAASLLSGETPKPFQSHAAEDSTSEY